MGSSSVAILLANCWMVEDWKGTAAPPMTLPVVPTPLISVLARPVPLTANR